MPAWMTPRRLGVVTTLYAVFLAGWWLGRPVLSGCLEDRNTAEADGSPAPVEPADPGRYLDNLGLDLGFPDFGLLDWADGMDGRRDGEYGPGDYGYAVPGWSATHDPYGDNRAGCSYKKRARLVAWVNGDWG